MSNTIKIIISRYSAKKQLNKQIKKGFEILNSTSKSFIELKKDRNIWKNYSSKLLKKIFSNRTICNEFLMVNLYKSEPENIIEFKTFLKKEINKLENIVEQLNLYESQLKLKTKVGNLLKNQYVAGSIFLILSFFLSNGFGLFPKEEKNENIIAFNKPFFDIEYYKIKIKNKGYQTFDTLNVNVKYQGSKIILNREFELVEYNFNDKYNFHLGDNNEYEPKLELTETIISNLILDSINKSQNILLQLKKQTIFDGFNEAYFEKTDKKEIGNLKFKFSYKYLDSTIIDTIRTKIYLIKKN
ncbi:hypothetical protein [Lutibacter flavus]|uniref:Uncharacterized protein n=1 Tax=Lutibacter flavus TaxID=691689 RepID=A0A238VU77_9FLAO|nr:hypothetical protein [Lutibacter flavus]SNR37890.1 hypothetical protein SAMN04488111_1049 [Lutibacter flavus]